VPPIPLELTLPEGLDQAGAEALLERRLKVEAGTSRSADRVLMDSFDGRLRAAGLRAERTGASLRLIEPGAPARVTETPGASGPLRLADLPEGPVRERLAGVLEVRALLPLARVKSRVHPVAVLNDDAKTVVRLEIEYARVGGTALAPRLRLAPVLGYDAAFERAEKALRAELTEAKAPLFDDAVRAAGGRPEGVSSKVGLKLARGLRADAATGAVLARLADIAEANVQGTLDDVDAEFLHDLRVAVRRARSVLRETEGVHPPAPWQRLRDELRWVQAMTGPVRDLDVQLEEWEALTSGLPAARRADLVPLHDLLAARRASELKAMRRGLQGKRFAAALEAWRALAAMPPAAREDADRPLARLAVDAVAADRIRAVYRRMVKDGAKIGDDTPDEALHELRKRGKELRYLLELFGGLFPAEVVKPMVGALKGLQDVLGRFQDRAVQADQLRGIGPELAVREGGPAALMALGLAVEALLDDQRAARADFQSRFAVFASAEERAQVKATFAAR
jgi:CHAD domain-containing protein